jgi:hypothetical protein
VNFEHALCVNLKNVKNSQDLLKAIKGYGLGDRHIGVFEPPALNLILLRRGLEGTSRTLAVAESGTAQPWKLDKLEQEILQFHNDQTRTPDAILVPWSDAGKGITVEKLEIRISKALAHYLDLIWQRGSVLAEAGTSSGRMDIFLVKEIFYAGHGPCIIEVKVLRSRGKNRSMPPEHALRWAKKGLIQAKLYKQDKAAATAYLCSFDAREKDTDLPALDTLAATLGIEHRKYFMHRSTGSLQTAELAKVDHSISIA